MEMLLDRLVGSSVLSSVSCHGSTMYYAITWAAATVVGPLLLNFILWHRFTLIHT